MCRPLGLALHPALWICVMRWGSLRGSLFIWSLRRDGAGEGLAGWPVHPGSSQQIAPQWSNLEPGAASFLFYATNVRALWACIVLVNGRWSAPHPHLSPFKRYLLTKKKRPIVAASAIHILLCCSRKVRVASRRCSMQDADSPPRSAPCLPLIKATSRQVISRWKHNSSKIMINSYLCLDRTIQ